MVVRREDEGYRTYCHFGTGNYHPVTRQDLHRSQLSSPPIPATGATPPSCSISSPAMSSRSDLETLAISPLDLRETLYAAVSTARSTTPARAARRRSGPSSMRSPKRASSTGSTRRARRGCRSCWWCAASVACAPGVPGLSENIAVKSIIGRFLEHSRIWAFAQRPCPAQPQGQAVHRQRRRDEPQPRPAGRSCWCRSATRRCTTRCSNRCCSPTCSTPSRAGCSIRRGRAATNASKADGDGFNCHDYFMTNPSLSGRGAALEGKPRAQADAAQGRQPDARLLPPARRARAQTAPTARSSTSAPTPSAWSSTAARRARPTAVAQREGQRAARARPRRDRRACPRAAMDEALAALARYAH